MADALPEFYQLGVEMANFKEFRLTIEGVIDGVAMTPETTPMSRLAEYLFDLAAIMGHNESVHFIRVDPGSTQPVIHIAAEEEARIISRMQSAQHGRSTKDANAAYKRFDARLRADSGIARVINVEKSANVIEFPGRTLATPQPYGPIRARATVVGELKRVGGLDGTVPIWLKRVDGEVFYCETKESVAKELGALIYKTIRLHGIATWKRDNEGAWSLDHFRIQSFDPEPLSSANFTETIEELRRLPENGWSGIDDPLRELRSMRNGEENSPQ